MSNSSSSSVQTEETSDIAPVPGSYRTYLSHCDLDDYYACSETLQALHPDPDDPVQVRFLNCRCYAWFVRHKETGQVRVHSNACRHRLCPFCSKAKATTISNNLFHWVKSLDRPKLLTLTLQHTNAPLDDQLDHLYTFFRRWRLRQPMKSHIKGGVWFVQLTRNDDKGQWHPHLHVVLDSAFLPHSTLAAAWKNVTHTSDILDIRAIKSPEKAASYVARYVSRPASYTKLDLQHRIEVHLAFEHRRMCGAFGTAHLAKLLARPKTNRHDWEQLGSYSVVVGLAPTSYAARAIIAAWLDRNPLPPSISHASVDFAWDHPGWDTDPDPPPDPNQDTFPW